MYHVLGLYIVMNILRLQSLYRYLPMAETMSRSNWTSVLPPGILLYFSDALLASSRDFSAGTSPQVCVKI